MDLEKILKALGEPTRLKIYNCLLERKHCVRSLSKRLEISEPAISQHLKIMREAGLVTGAKFGHHTHYVPNQEALDFITAEFAAMQQKSALLDRDMTVCRCEYRKENEPK